MTTFRLFYPAMVAVGMSVLASCAGVKPARSNEPDYKVRLNIQSLHARQIQETGKIDTDNGDEPVLVYALMAYDGRGRLQSVNNGFWGNQTVKQDQLVLSDQFDTLNIPVPRDGNVILAMALLEIDDYRGERKIAPVQEFTQSVRYPNLLKGSRFSKDVNERALELIAQSLKVAGYKNFRFKQMDLSANDLLGSEKRPVKSSELATLLNQADTKTVDVDGSRVNEAYSYRIKYRLSVHSPPTTVNSK